MIMYNCNKIVYSRLFPKLDKEKYKLLKIDTESISYITTPNSAKQITQIIKSYFNKQKLTPNTIIDCTACVGGDSISFANTFNKVFSIEIDKNRYEMLINNINIYELSNISVFNCNCLEQLKKLSNSFIQVVYFDPPWGGSDYKISTNLRLSIGTESIEKITVDLITRKYLKKPPIFIIFKLPKNYDIHYFFIKVTIKKEIKIYLHELKKINIIIVENNYTDNDYIIIE
jgi:16S rRNA G966 N2-methylase RsmD